MFIVCKESKKSGKKYLVLEVNRVAVTFDRFVIERVALTNGISNIELEKLDIDDYIKIKDMEG